MNLFQQGNFKLHSGKSSKWKIDCDALQLEDWETLAQITSEIIPSWGPVLGVPTGGEIFAKCLRKHSVEGGRLLIADDVLTTGGSMEEIRVGRDAMGIVVFARGKCPDWIIPIFQYYYGGSK